MSELTTKIINGVLKVTHPTGVISEYTAADYDRLIEWTQNNVDDSKKELIALQSVRQELISSKGI